MSKYGSPSGVFLFDGYDLLAHKLQATRVLHQANTEPYHGIGDSWEENIPTGLQRAEVAQEGAFFDDATWSIHLRLGGAAGSPDNDPNATAGSAIVGFAGNTAGAEVYQANGNFAMSYEVISQVNALTRANVEYQVTGQVDRGKLLIALGSQTADGNTEAASIDNAASSSNGGVGVLQVTSLDLSGGTSFDVTVQDSADDIAWASLVAFTARTTIGSESKTVAGTVDRYLSITWDFTGTPVTPSATFTVAFARR